MPLDSVIDLAKRTTFYLCQRSTEPDVGSSEQGQNTHHDGNKEPLTIQTDVTAVPEVGSAGPITGVGNSPEEGHGGDGARAEKNLAKTLKMNGPSRRAHVCPRPSSGAKCRSSASLGGR